jgi:hypothetical protein
MSGLENNNLDSEFHPVHIHFGENVITGAKIAYFPSQLGLEERCPPCFVLSRAVPEPSAPLASYPCVGLYPLQMRGLG